jgi:hypothetical protein
MIILSRVMPALLIRISTVPNVSTTWLTASVKDWKSDTSAAIDMALPPFDLISVSTDFKASMLRLINTTLAPALDKLCAIELPIPREAPVTIAILFDKLKI